MTSNTRTTDGPPWNSRRYGGGHPRRTRSSYEIDCDRIVHSESFRDLQHKTQVQGLMSAAGQAFRTRLNHVIEVAQLAAGIASDLRSDSPLARAIALAHDLGHPPFGHAGERALQDVLRSHGAEGWNANVHSLAVVDEIECAYIDFRGLNLTWATREGIARHSTPFDVPVSFGQFGATPNAGIECQIVDAADVLAYLSHDLDDAIRDQFVDLEELRGVGEPVASLVDEANRRWSKAVSPWPNIEQPRLVRRFIVAKLISASIRDIATTTEARIAELEVNGPGAVRACDQRVVAQSGPFAEMTKALLQLLSTHYYRSDAVRASDAAAAQIITGLFEWYLDHIDQVPERFRMASEAIAVANFIASLNDVSAYEQAVRHGIATPAQRDATIQAS
jgi:dGTPase